MSQTKRIITTVLVLFISAFNFGAGIYTILNSTQWYSYNASIWTGVVETMDIRNYDDSSSSFVSFYTIIFASNICGVILSGLILLLVLTSMIKRYLASKTERNLCLVTAIGCFIFFGFSTIYYPIGHVHIFDDTLAIICAVLKEGPCDSFFGSDSTFDAHWGPEAGWFLTVVMAFLSLCLSILFARSKVNRGYVEIK